MARYPQQVEMARKLGAGEPLVRDDSHSAAVRLTSGKLYTGALKNRMFLGGFDVDPPFLRICDLAKSQV